GAGFAKNHQQYESSRDWGSDYRSQCTRDAFRNRSGLHHQRRKNFPAWDAGTIGKRFGSQTGLFGGKFFVGVKRSGQWSVDTATAHWERNWPLTTDHLFLWFFSSQGYT